MKPAIRNPQSAVAGAGFTLLEVLIAMALVGIAVSALMSGMSGSLRNLARAENYERAVLVGRAQLNRLLVEQPLVPGRLAGRWDESVRWEAEIRRWNPACRACRACRDRCRRATGGAAAVGAGDPDGVLERRQWGAACHVRDLQI